MNMEHGTKKIDRWQEALKNANIPLSFRRKDISLAGSRFAKFANTDAELISLISSGKSITIFGNDKALENLYLLIRASVLYSIPSKVIWLDTIAESIEAKTPTKSIVDKLSMLKIIGIPCLALHNYSKIIEDGLRYRIERILTESMYRGTSLVIHADSEECLRNAWSRTFVSKLTSNSIKEVIL